MNAETVIALLGLGTTTLVALGGQLAQGRRETARLTWDRQARLIDQRRVIYQDFSSEFDKWVRVLYERDTSTPPPHGDELDYMYDKLSEIRLFGSWDAYNFANRTLHDLNSWLMASDQDDAAGPRWARASHDEFVGQVRIDLGAEPPLAPEPRIERAADWIAMRWPDRLRRHP